MRNKILTIKIESKLSKAHVIHRLECQPNSFEESQASLWALAETKILGFDPGSGSKLFEPMDNINSDLEFCNFENNYSKLIKVNWFLTAQNSIYS
jgi:hypothetical protein